MWCGLWSSIGYFTWIIPVPSGNVVEHDLLFFFRQVPKVLHHAFSQIPPFLVCVPRERSEIFHISKVQLQECLEQE